MPPGEVEVPYEEDEATGDLVDVNLDSSLETRPLAPGEHATPEDAVAPIAAEVLQKILMRMKIRGRIVRRDTSEEGEAAFPDDEPSLVLNVTGLSERDQNALIGRRGETLDALQFLLNLIVGRSVDLWTRVIVDVEGYRLRRKFALINLARRTADQVQARNQAIPLEAMPPYERRIIHMALSDHPAVATESSGVEPDRRVVVLPK
jgi:spoIIIJ-associated protein